MSRLDEFFKWKIGDAVTHVNVPVYPQVAPFDPGATPEERKAWRRRNRYGRASEEIRLVVIERLLQECHGGMQMLYRVRAVGGQLTGELLQLTEIELRPLTPPDLETEATEP